MGVARRRQGQLWPLSCSETQALRRAVFSLRSGCATPLPLPVQAAGSGDEHAVRVATGGSRGASRAGRRLPAQRDEARRQRAAGRQALHVHRRAAAAATERPGEDAAGGEVGGRASAAAGRGGAGRGMKAGMRI